MANYQEKDVKMASGLSTKANGYLTHWEHNNSKDLLGLLYDVSKIYGPFIINDDKWTETSMEDKEDMLSTMLCEVEYNLLVCAVTI